MNKTSGATLAAWDLLRAGDIKRWHIVSTAREQTLADHSYMVTVIALVLNNTLNNGTTTPGYMLSLIAGALFHDATETLTGDIPTPSKALIEKHAPGVLEAIDRELMPDTPFIGGAVSGETARLIKMADTIEAAHWIRENGTGKLAGRIAAMCYQKVEVLTARYIEETGNEKWREAVDSALMALSVRPLNRDSRLFSP